MFRKAYGDWNERTLCRTRDPREYSLEGRGRPIQTKAKLACLGCPVKRECAQDALESGDWGVIRGGVAIYGRSKTVQKLLEYVAEHGDLPTQRAQLDVAEATRCVECDQRLRPWGSLESAHPGTEKRGGAKEGSDYCHSCWELEKERTRWAA
jgi:hypothetical protein